MSVTVRLSRIGKKKSPAFKVVVANTKDKRDGKAVEILGYYNPSHNPPLLEIDKAKLEDWKKKGAIVSKAVADLAEDKYVFTPYTRQNEAQEGGEVAAAPVEEAPAPEAPAAE